MATPIIWNTTTTNYTNVWWTISGANINTTIPGSIYYKIKTVKPYIAQDARIPPKKEELPKKHAVDVF